MRRLLLTTVFVPAALSAAACLNVSGDRISGSDLAAADSSLSTLPASLQIGYAPLAGTKRVFTTAELQRIAHASGIVAPGVSEICFEVPSHTPSDSEFIESMRHSLPGEAKLRVVDMIRTAIPAGRLEFPLSGLEPSSTGNGGSQLWRGFIQYTDTRRVSVWARVAIAVTYTSVVARRDLPADTPIEASTIIVETRTGPLKRDPSATRVDQVAGKVLHRPVKGGAEILLSALDSAPVVHRGDSVRIEVRSGLAVLHFDAVAESTVRAGEFAEFRNPITGKTFRARVETAARAVVVVAKEPS